ncbi:MAG: YaiI/YqxD family protein [Bacilli bacterium]
MKIIIDADACPVIAETIALGKKYKIEVMLITDTAHVFSKYDVPQIVVDQGADAVDWKIMQCLERGDILITQDYGLASMSLPKTHATLHHNGWVYTDYNIDELLARRHFQGKMRRAGQHSKGPKKRTTTDNTKYIATLEDILQKLQQ